MPIYKAYILLGSNKGRRNSFLTKAKKQIELLCGRIEKESSVYQTAAWGTVKQQDFLNQIIIINTTLLPDELMNMLLNIEVELGRIRTIKYGPRTIDLDILFYDELVYKSKIVTLPHPAIKDRKFVLVPMVEVSPLKKHPALLKTMKALLKACADELEVKKVER